MFFTLYYGIVLVPWFSCLGGYLSVPDDYPLVLECEEHVSSLGIGTVFQGPGLETWWGCMFFTLYYSIVLVPWFSCLGGYLCVPDDYPLVLECEEHVSSLGIGTVFQGPGLETRWGCMFFTLYYSKM